MNENYQGMYYLCRPSFCRSFAMPMFLGTIVRIILIVVGTIGL